MCLKKLVQELVSLLKLKEGGRWFLWSEIKISESSEILKRSYSILSHHPIVHIKHRIYVIYCSMFFDSCMREYRRNGWEGGGSLGWVSFYIQSFGKARQVDNHTTTYLYLELFLNSFSMIFKTKICLLCYISYELDQSYSFLTALILPKSHLLVRLLFFLPIRLFLLSL